MRGLPLIRTPRTLPRVLEPGQVDVFVAALRTHRDLAMIGRWSSEACGGARFWRCGVRAYFTYSSAAVREPPLRPPWWPGQAIQRSVSLSSKKNIVRSC